MRIYDLLYKKADNKGKARWEKVGVLIDKEDGKKSIKLDLIPVSSDSSDSPRRKRMGRVACGIRAERYGKRILIENIEPGTELATQEQVRARLSPIIRVL